MKTAFNALFALIVMLALSLTAQAQKWVSGTSTDIGATNTYQRCVVASDTATSVTFVENLNFALAAGDQLYIATVNASIPVAAATVSVLDDTFVGTEGRPLLIDLDGTSASQINTITVEYKATR